MNTTTKTLTAEQTAQVESYVKQGTDRETAIRVVTAKGRKPIQDSRQYAALNGERGFSLLK
jgi:hypothetical protein